MPHVVPVKFAYAIRDLWFDAAGLDIIEGDHVICATERGTEIGITTSDPFDVTSDELRARTDRDLKPVLRVADDDDLDWAEEQADKGDDAYPIFRRIVGESGLDIKPVGVEYLFGGEKVVCYFAAEDRVDFRQLVRDLSRELHERIDMRQIGVREEAALIGGFAHCGQELCCARFGRQFEPVSIRMAKEQDLPLNSTKISGVCGRLMCCLRYEFEAYRDFKSRAPKKNAVIQTPLGTAKIIEYDTPKEQLALRLESGKVVRVPLAGMTCSEAACKKSEELKCPCRPDTVPREVLESLATTDIQMALAELDRKNGVLPDDTEAASDLFDDVAPTPSRRKRRHSSVVVTEEAADEAAEQAEAPKRHRRRRGGAGQAEAAEAEPVAPTRRRRHHHTENVQAEGEQAEGTTKRPDGSPSDRPKKGMQPRRRRKPGDQGGAVAAAENTPKEAVEQQDGAPKKRRRRRKPKTDGEGAPQEQTQQAPKSQSSEQAAGEGGEASKKRRRRRRRKPSGGEGQPPAPETA